MPCNALSSLYPNTHTFSGCMLLSSLTCSFAAFYSPASNRSDFNSSFIAVHCYYTEREQCHPQDWSHQPSLLFIYPSIPSSLHPLTLSPFSHFIQNPSPMLACYNLPFSSIHYFSPWFIHLFNSLSLQKHLFVFHYLPYCLIRQKGRVTGCSITWQTLSKWTHRPISLDAPTVYGKWISYSICQSSYWHDTGCITQLLCLLKWVSEK